MTAASTTPQPQTETFDIETTSKACGLSAGVLRMWELRYGWPRPGRHANGYRYFTRYQIDELKRMSTLVKSGMLISRLIQDGMPKWPAEMCEPVKIVTLDATKALPAPVDPQARELRDRLVDALHTKNYGRTFELLQRASWEAKMTDQATAAWLPLLVAMAEYRACDKSFPREDALLSTARDHLKGLLARLPACERPLWVVPTTPEDTTLAYVTALVMSQRGTPARPWLWEQLPRGGAAFVSVGAEPQADRFPKAQHRGHYPLQGARSVVALQSDPAAAT
ncbi:MAG TPA: MerR family transcriptional regulator [Planctomycetota bacterium]|nr:MerR family transcriptional regulator [Planctomycetota bacterium]